MLYNTGQDAGCTGIVVSARATGILCSYFQDGGTMQKLCTGDHVPPNCVPGCYTGIAPNDVWCDSSWGIRDPLFYSCAFRPRDTARMLAYHISNAHSYNEIVLDTHVWEEHLPATVEAFVYTRSGNSAKACACLKQMLAEFPSARGRIPLVSYEPTDERVPFRDETSACLGQM